MANASLPLNADMAANIRITAVICAVALRSNLFREKLQGAIGAAGGLLRKDECRKIFEDPISGRRGFRFLPWRLIGFGGWSKKFLLAI
jgi:hypothetical protein